MDPTEDKAEDSRGLAHFVHAQQPVWEQVIDELRAGRKRSHWMWFVFPQLVGLGHSPMAQRYGIASLAQARAYLAHPLLGPRLTQCTELLLAHRGLSAQQIFGTPDDLKLRSCMTLFSLTDPGEPSGFQTVLERYFDGEPDAMSLRLLAAKD